MATEVLNFIEPMKCFSKTNIFLMEYCERVVEMANVDENRVRFIFESIYLYFLN